VFVSGTVVGEESSLIAEWQSPQLGSLYEYEVQVQGSSEARFTMSVSVIEVALDSLTIETVMAGSGFDTVHVTDTFAAANRAHVSYEGYYG